MCIKDYLEIIYYVAFIVLTWRIVAYAGKTYTFQSDPTSELYCKLYVPERDLGRVDQLLCLEIYNHGNIPAEDVCIFLDNKETATIDFIQAEKSATLLIGEVQRMIGCNRVFIQDSEIHNNELVSVDIKTKNGSVKHFKLNTTSLFLHSEMVKNENERMANAVEDLNKSFQKAFDCHSIGPSHNTFRDELCNIANNISKLKR